MECWFVKWARRYDSVLGGRGGMRRGDRGVRVPGQRVVVDAWSRLICAGWVPQGRVFGGSGIAV